MDISPTHKINSLHERYLRIVYLDTTYSFKEPYRNIHVLATEKFRFEKGIDISINYEGSTPTELTF